MRAGGTTTANGSVDAMDPEMAALPPTTALRRIATRPPKTTADTLRNKERIDLARDLSAIESIKPTIMMVGSEPQDEEAIDLQGVALAMGGRKVTPVLTHDAISLAGAQTDQR